MTPPDTIPMYDEAVYLRMASETPLPGGGTPPTTPAVERNVADTATFGLYAPPRSQLPVPPNSLPVPRRLKRGAPPAEIEIYIDPDTAGPPPKKSATARKDGRTPLGERKDFGNACPRTPETPGTSTFTPSVEDWNRFAHLFTPPATPQFRPDLATRVAPKEPVDMMLYDFLETRNWKASTAEIKAAYKKVALLYHPDKVTEETKESAHDMMTLINAARDVLVDKHARAKYHKDGKAPPVFVQMMDAMGATGVVRG